MENIIGSRIASFIVLSKYNKLIDLTLAGMEDSQEYKDEIKELKRLFEAERKEYNRVTKEEVNTYFNNFNDSKLNNLLDMREFNKLKERKRVLEGNVTIGKNILLSSVISSKLSIDIIKDVDDKIKHLLFEGKIENEVANVLNLYNQRYKYHYFTANNFIEAIAIDKDFNINNIEKIHYHEIEEAFNIKFIDKSQNIFYEYIMAAINDLSKIDTLDQYEYAYLSMLYVAKVKSMLPYLNKEMLIKVSDNLTNNNYRYDKNSALAKVKRLVNRKKEDLEN